MKKRILALMLACFMIVSLLPVQAFAVEDEPKCPSTHAVENCDCTEIATIPALCEVWGYTVYQCNDCGEYFVDDTVAPLGDHVLEAVEGKAPTCTEAGVKDSWKCTVCEWQYTMDNDQLVRVTSEDELVIPALGHDYVIERADEEGVCKATVTCTRCDYCETTEGEHVWADIPTIGLDPNEHLLEDGWAVYQCVVCGEFSDRVVILHHVCEKFAEAIPGKDPTCTETGLKDSWKCRLCGRQFIDGQTEPIESEEELIIPALGHLSSDVFVPFAETIVVDEPFTYFYYPASPYYWIAPYDCVVTNITKDFDEYVIVYNAAGDELTGEFELNEGEMLFFLVEGVGNLEIAYEVDPVKLAVEGNCQQTGSVTYVCARCSETITEEVHGSHNLVKFAEQEATCTSMGFIAIVCTVEGCDYHEFIDLDMKAHTEDPDGQVLVPAGCGSTGLMGYYCTVCGTLLRTEEITALVHDYVGVVTTEANCVTKQVTTYTCKYCGDSYEVEGDYGPHVKPENLDEYLEINWPTCTEDGNCLYFCTLCEYYVDEVLPATGHLRSYTYNYYDCYGEYFDEETQMYKNGPVTVEAFECLDCGYYHEVVTPVDRGFMVVYNSLEDAQEDHAWGYSYDFSTTLEAEGYADYKEHLYNELIDCGYLREATCTISALHLYQCSYCEEYLVVEEPANGHNYVVDTALAPTCTEHGYTTGGYCADCDTYIAPEKIPATGHSIKPDTATTDKAPTCTAPGSLRGGQCEFCGKWFHITTVDGEDVYTEVADADALVIPQLYHHYEVVDSYLATEYDPENDPGFLYVHLRCPNCGDEFINNFHRHGWILDEVATLAPTCTLPGLNVYNCFCGMVKEEVVDPLGHTYGEEICENFGKTCERCNHVCDVAHTYTVTHVDANCVTGAHDLYVCDICRYYFAVELSEPDPDAHQWGTPEIIYDENGYETGKGIFGCQLCGFVTVRDMDPYVHYNVTISSEDLLIIGSEMAVTITMSGNTASVWGFDMDILYDEESLEFVRYEFGANFNGFVQDNWTEDPIYNRADYYEYNSYVSVAANADVSATVTEEVVVTLYFNVIDVIDGFISIKHNMTTNPELEPIQAFTTGAAYDVFMMMDYYQDDKIDLLDVQAVYNYIAGTEGFEYCVLGDVDQNGVIDLLDLEAIYKYIVG